VAGSTAAVAVHWLAPVLIGLSLLLLGRAFYILYLRGCGTRMSKLITWLSAFFVVGFWTWRLISNV